MEWRSTWGDTGLLQSLGHVVWAVGTWRATSSSTASRLRSRPCAFGKSGSVGVAARSRSHARSTAATFAERRAAFLAALADALDVRAVPRSTSEQAEPGELGDSQSGLHGDRQNGVIAPADPGSVRRDEQRLGLSRAVR